MAEFPDVVYIVLGATHPNELLDHGEAYRLSLEILAKRNKLEKYVIFYNHFVDLENLKEFIGAADLYITPYLNEAQITSGTLAYTFGAGKAVVSTPYWHATELLTGDQGVLVPFANDTEIRQLPQFLWKLVNLTLVCFGRNAIYFEVLGSVGQKTL